MRVGGYTLHLYCDLDARKDGEVADARGHRYDEFPHEFYGQTGPECDRKARKAGWLIGQRDLCPRCSGKRPRGFKKG